MKGSWILPGLLVAASVGCKSSSNPSAGSALSQPSSQQAQVNVAPSPAVAPPKPKYGWKEFHSETFETHPVPIAIYQKPFVLPRGISKLRVELKADSGILAGAFPEDALIRNPKVRRTQDFARMPCALISEVVGSAKCNVDGSERIVYLVRDNRAEGTDAGGLFGFLRRSNKLAERAALPNKVHIELSSWQCIENCKR